MCMEWTVGVPLGDGSIDRRNGVGGMRSFFVALVDPRRKGPIPPFPSDRHPVGSAFPRGLVPGAGLDRSHWRTDENEGIIASEICCIMGWNRVQIPAPRKD